MSIYRTCADCGFESVFPLDTPVTLSCQKCGSPYVKFSKALVINCHNCGENASQFISPTNIIFTICKECHKGIWIARTDLKDKKKKAESIPLPEPDLMKIVIPYFEGGPKIERALKSWIRPEVVFAVNDIGIIPPGSGICSQFYSALQDSQP